MTPSDRKVIQSLVALLLLVTTACSGSHEGPSAAGAGTSAAVAITDAPPASGSARMARPTYRDPDGLFTIVLPSGWESQRTGFGQLVAQPPGADSAHGLLMLSYDELKPEQVGVSVTLLLEQAETDLRATFEAQGLSAWRARGPARDAQGAAGNGAHQAYEARGPLGPVQLWIGSRVIGPHSWSLLGVFSGPDRSDLEERVMAAFDTLHPIEPVRDSALEGSLLGAEFAASSNFDTGAIHTVYSFSAPGAVSRRTMMSASFGFGGSTGSDRVEHGTARAINGHLVLMFPEGSAIATPERQGASVRALLIDQRRYARR